MMECLNDPAALLERLADGARSGRFLIGVRHHSPVLAAAVPAMLDAAAPDRVLVELPSDFETWIAWLADPRTVAPIALAAVRDDGERLAFWPFADFSPELAALRWAREHGVPVEPFDLPLGEVERVEASGEDASTPGEDGSEPRAGEIGARLRAAWRVNNDEELWDRMVEVPGSGASPERVRRAAIAFGIAVRADARAVSPKDLAREEYMRQCLARRSGERVAVVAGAFHIPALIGEPDPAGTRPGTSGNPAAPEPVAAAGTVAKASARAPAKSAKPGERGIVSSLVPYTFELLDSRSGYPAGIRDPAWQQAVFSCSAAPEEVELAAATMIVSICGELRRDGHVAGVPDAKEALRVARDLANLRGNPAVGRREVVEAVQSTLANGETLGRGRAVARVMERVMVGRTSGRLAPGTPKSGLRPHVEATLARLRLPGPGKPGQVELRLDPLRGGIDRERQVALCGLAACQIPYATPVASEGAGGVEAIGHRWRVSWQPSTAPMLELAGVRGVTLEQAASGSIRARENAARRGDGVTPELLLALTKTAAECGLTDLTRRYCARLAGDFLTEAGLGALTGAYDLVKRIMAGHVPGIPDGLDLPEECRPSAFQPAIVAAVEGIAGSDDLADARALLSAVRVAAEAGATGRLTYLLRRFAESSAPATPLIQGAATAGLVLLGAYPGADFGSRLGSWVDAAVDPDSRRALIGRLGGVLIMAGPLLETYPHALTRLSERVERLPDQRFVTRLPALRAGFEVLSPADRDRFLASVTERIGTDHGAAVWTLDRDPRLLAGYAAADAAGREAAGPWLSEVPAPSGATAGSDPDPAGSDPARERPADPDPDALTALDRWRLVLGRQRDQLPRGWSGKAAAALDELYGFGHGEGSGAGIGGRSGGSEASYPTAREWASELENLFGTAVRDEVLARAVENGRNEVLFTVDPETVVPSVDLLQRVLTLAGGLGEAKLAQLRRLVERVVAALTMELAVRLRPALTGLTTPRPTRRPGGPVNLRRTVMANLKTARYGEDGLATIVAEDVIFSTRSRRSAEWDIVLVVDVSGSMEASTIYSAVVAAILAGVPALSVRFVAFSTQVVDLSDQVTDPLSLLLEVSVGGGTNIGKALRYVREQITVPSRTIVAVVSDFEEGGSVTGLLAEVRALVESGVRVLGLAALDDRGAPEFNRAIAGRVAAAGMPVAALTPLELARWIGERVRA